MSTVAPICVKPEPGQRLRSERALAESLGVGRSVVREALKSLTLLGLVEVQQGDGTFLQSSCSNLLPISFEWGLLLDEHQLLDIIEARTELEVVLAGFAAERRSEQDVQELGELLRGMRNAPDTGAFVTAEVAAARTAMRNHLTRAGERLKTSYSHPMKH